MEKAELERYLAEGLSLEAIGRRAGRAASTVGYWVDKHGLVAVHHGRRVSRGGITRQRLEGLVEAGLSSRAIAARLGLSGTTVRYWLDHHGLETRRTALGRARRRTDGSPPIVVESTCPRHGQVKFRLEPRGTYRCLLCRADSVTRRRRAVRDHLVREAGGCCALCGYDRYIGSLHFHHLDPGTKSFGVSERGLARSLARAREEARKCVLLCSNCHGEVEAGRHPLERLSELRGWDSNPQPLG